MKLILTRSSKEYRGVFGKLESEDGAFKCVTLEHAYPVFDNNFTSKIPVGEYLCVRGMHRLEGMKDNFETFEITKVPGHNHILLHVGNYNKDSNGCVLVGAEIVDEDKIKMITNSKATFAKLMELLAGLGTFTLVVK